MTKYTPMAFLIFKNQQKKSATKKEACHTFLRSFTPLSAKLKQTPNNGAHREN